MPRCNNCGVNNIETYYYGGKNYCKEHYDEHMQNHQDVEFYFAVKTIKDGIEEMKKMPDHIFDKLMRD